MKRVLRGFAIGMLFAGAATAQNGAATLTRSGLPSQLSDREFWQLVSDVSEPGGYFRSDNFVSNEMSFQHPIPTLQKIVGRPANGVYLGVGPEQNFTYIVNLEPKMAIIFDIRRQNMILHLMYKAIAEMSPTRADFLAMLFSRKRPPGLDTASSPQKLFDSYAEVEQDDAIYGANLKAIRANLIERHGFALTPDDELSLGYVYSAFYAAGPRISYNTRASAGAVFAPAAMSPYMVIQTQTNADGVNMAYLATEANYRKLRNMHARNLIVPVVGNFSGPTAIRTVASWLKARDAKVTAFYVSNVEQYLYQQGDDWSKFYRNVETLPFDSTSQFIRSVPAGSGGGTFSTNGATFSFQSIRIITNGVGTTTTTITTIDSTGKPVTKTTVDSTGIGSRPQVPISMTVNSGLVSGIASIGETIRALNDGKIFGYQTAIQMTKTEFRKER